METLLRGSELPCSVMPTRGVRIHLLAHASSVCYQANLDGTKIMDGPGPAYGSFRDSHHHHYLSTQRLWCSRISCEEVHIKSCVFMFWIIQEIINVTYVVYNRLHCKLNWAQLCTHWWWFNSNHKLYNIASKLYLIKGFETPWNQMDVKLRSWNEITVTYI